MRNGEKTICPKLELALNHSQPRAVTPAAKNQGQPSCRHGPARKDKVSLPVASFVAPSGRDGTNQFESPPGHRAERHHRQHRQRPLTLSGNISSLPLKWKATSARKSRMLRGVGQGRAVTSCAGMRPTARRKDKFARSDKSHIVRHKIGRWGKATGGPGTGDPARPRAGHFMIAQCVLILRAREHRPRRRAPVRPHSANLGKMGARIESLAASREARRRRTSRAVRSSLSACDGFGFSIYS